MKNNYFDEYGWQSFLKKLCRNTLTNSSLSFSNYCHCQAHAQITSIMANHSHSPLVSVFFYTQSKRALHNHKSSLFLPHNYNDSSIIYPGPSSSNKQIKSLFHLKAETAQNRFLTPQMDYITQKFSFVKSVSFTSV